MLRSVRIAALIVAAFVPLIAVAEAPAPERVIEFRQNVYSLVAWNFGPMGQMVRGQRDLDTAEFAKRAAHVAALAKMLDEGFPPGSDKGADTEALPAIWTERADFDKKMAAFVTETAALATLSAGGDIDAIKAQFGKTAATCKACHDDYKAD